MSAGPTRVRDDRVLPFTRVLAMVILPFLVVGFLVLYPVPDSTDWLFAWTITPTMTSMMLASAYLGGAYFFWRVARAEQWHRIKVGFPAVALFASMLGIATFIHWDRFHHQHLAFWIWTALYVGAPFLVVAAWWTNRTHEAPATAADVLLGPGARWAIGLVGLLALVTGLAMFLAPSVMIPLWPWFLTPLTCRVVGAAFCLGSALVVVRWDPRWTTLRLMFAVEVIMLALILVAAVRARAEFYLDRPLTWLMLVGFVATLIGSGLLWRAMERTATRPEPPAAT